MTKQSLIRRRQFEIVASFGLAKTVEENSRIYDLNSLSHQPHVFARNGMTKQSLIRSRQMEIATSFGLANTVEE